MRVALTAAALKDLDEILEYLSLNYPSSIVSFEASLNLTISRIGDFPESSPAMAGRGNVRIAPLNRYPYKVFYRVALDFVEVLFIHHAARNDFDVK